MHGATLGGLAPPLTFTAGKPHPVDCWYYALLKDGKYSTPFGRKPVCSTSSGDEAENEKSGPEFGRPDNPLRCR